MLSISAHNSEKLKCTGFNSPPPPELAFQFINSSMALTRSQSLALDSWICQRLTRERAYSPVLKYNEGLWKSEYQAYDRLYDHHCEENIYPNQKFFCPIYSINSKASIWVIKKGQVNFKQTNHTTCLF